MNRVVSTVDSLPSYSAADSFNGQIIVADGLVACEENILEL